MKVSGSGGVSQTGGPKSARAAGGGEGFRLGGATAAIPLSQAASVAGPRGVMGVEALIALQDVGGPLERKRRSMSRAGRILDVLDGIKISMLGGDLNEAQLHQLSSAVREQRSATDDPRLEGVLDEIETRAAVELAKLEGSRRAA